MKHLLWVVALTWGSCTIPQAQKQAQNSLPARALLSENKLLQDSFVHSLHPGDLVLRTGADITSTMFCQINSKEKTYSHCGIVMIEHGYPFIYHSIGGEDNPDAKIRRDSASFWCTPIFNLGMAVCRFDFSPAQQDSLLHIVKNWYGRKLMFDMDFDLATDNKLYCAEMIYKAANLAAKDSNYIQPLVLFGRRFVAIDNLYLNEHVKMICQLRYK